MKEDDVYALRRQENADEEMLRPESRAWIAQLPPYLALHSLTHQFPRIVNRIAGLWSTPVQCECYLDELLFNDRSGIRQGFPPDVCRELMQLKCAVVEIFDERRKSAQPQLSDVWGKF